MNIFRYGHDTFGERVLNGVSWDLLPVAFWAGIAVIVVHLGWRVISRNSGSKGGG
jgi:hypothetical protein